jgi:hypothetical protein
MTILRHPQRPFPPDLGRAVCRMAACLTLVSAETFLESTRYGEVEPGPMGYLANVPLFRGVPVLVQLELLARVHALHVSPRAHRLNLLGGMVLYAAVEDAFSLAAMTPDVAAEVLSTSPVPIDLAFNDQTGPLLRATFRDFWGEPDFLDLGPREDLDVVRHDRQRLPRRLAACDVRAVLAALSKTKASRTLVRSLTPFLTPDELRQVRVLIAEASRLRLG